MSKKPSSIKRVKSLFSKTDTNPDKSVENGGQSNGEEKKKFKIFNFKSKSKIDSLREKSDEGNQEVHSGTECAGATVDGDAFPDNSKLTGKSAALYGTAPRSKVKDLSYSELDLRKPRRFATFSSVFRKKTKRGKDFSKSTMVLHSPGIEQQEKESLDVNQWEVDKSTLKTMFTMSQPELDTTDTFDMPSPLVTTSQSQFYVPVPVEPSPSVSLNSAAEPVGASVRSADVCDVGGHAGKAPIAAIPELQCDDDTTSGSGEEHDGGHDNPSVYTFHYPSAPSSCTQPVAAPGSSFSTPQMLLLSNADDHKGNADSTLQYPGLDNGDLSKDVIPKYSLVKDHHSGRADTNAAYSNDCPIESQPNATPTEPVANSDTAYTNPSTVYMEVSVPNIEADKHDTASSVTRITTSLSVEDDTPCGSNASVRGTLCESLFPLSFASDILSAGSNSALTAKTLITATSSSEEGFQQFADCSRGQASFLEREAVQNSPEFTVSSMDTNTTDTSCSYQLASSSSAVKMATVNTEHVSLDAVSNKRYLTFTSDDSRAVSGSSDDVFATLSEALFPSSFYTADMSESKQPTRADLSVWALSGTNSSFPSSSSCDPVGGHGSNTANLPPSCSGVKPDRFDPLPQAARSSSLAEKGSPSPPSPGVKRSSPETSAQPADAPAGVVFVRVTTTAQASARPGHRSVPEPRPEGVAAADIAMEEVDEGDWAERDPLSAARGPPVDRAGAPPRRSPELTRVWSDDSSTAEVYYSAEEDSLGDSGEDEMHTAGEPAPAPAEPSGGPALGHDTPDASHARLGAEEEEEEEEESDHGLMKRQEAAGGHESAIQHLVNGASVSTGAESTKAWLEMRTRSVTEQGEGEGEGREERLALQVGAVGTPSSECGGAVSRRLGEASVGNAGAHVYWEVDDPPRDYMRLPGPETATANTLAGSEEPAADTCLARTGRESPWGEPAGLVATAEDPSCTNCDESRLPETRGEMTHRALADTAAVPVRGVSLAETVSAVTRAGKQQAEPEGAGDNAAGTSSEWACPVTHSTDKTCSVPEALTVELSVTAVDTNRRDAFEGDDRPLSLPPAHNSLDVTEVLRKYLEVVGSDADLQSDDRMSRAYSSLSTVLSGRPPARPHEGADRSTPRFRKVSLVGETDAAGPVEGDATDLGRPGAEACAADPASNQGGEPETYKWRNVFDGVVPYTPPKSPLNSAVSDSLPAPLALETNGYQGSRLSSDNAEVNRSHRGTEEPELSGRGGSVWEREGEVPAVVAAEEGEARADREAEEAKPDWSSENLPFFSSSSSSEPQHDLFTGVFQATRVHLVPDPTSPSSFSPTSPDTGPHFQSEMESLVSTLKSMEPMQKHRPMRCGSLSGPALPPIVEDAPSPTLASVPVTFPNPVRSPVTEAPHNGLYTLPADLGLKWSTPKEMKSPLDMMKQTLQEQQLGARSLQLPLRASAMNSIVMRTSSAPGDGPPPADDPSAGAPGPTSRLNGSLLFSSYRSGSEQPAEGGQAGQRSLYRAASLSELDGGPRDRLSVAGGTSGSGASSGAGYGAGPGAPRGERSPFLSSASLSGADDLGLRISRPLQLSVGSPPASNSPNRLLSPTGSIDLQRHFTYPEGPFSGFGQTQGLGMGTGMGTGLGTGALGTQVLQRSFSSEGLAGHPQTPLFSTASRFRSPEPEPERPVVPKYRAFPDAYLTKEKEHGKLNPRPGKMFIFDRPGMCGQRIEIRGDVIDATPWQLQETISIRVVRGGWVLYEKPNFKGEKIALDEGDIELSYPFNPPEDEQYPLHNGDQQHIVSENDGQDMEQTNGVTEETSPARRFIIGSIRRAVRDYSVPEISLFPEENAEGKKVIFRDTSEDARIFGFPIKATSIIVNAGLWLVYAEPFFQGVPRILEVGGFSNPAAWGVDQPYVGSLHPLKIGEPRVENPNEPKMVIYEKPYFSGKSRTIYSTVRDFMTKTDKQQKTFMYNVASLKVQGGIWVGYEKEGFRGHQYLLEEGEYHDWRVWGGCDSELRSVRVIRAELSDHMLVMYEQPEEEEEMQEENTFEVTEAIPDVELFGFKTNTQSIQVLNGAWVAYSHVDFSGNQFILEKGFYSNCADWGSQDNRICSIQPILLAPSECSKSRNEILLYSEADFQGECLICDCNLGEVPDKVLSKSCRVVGGSWVVYDGKQYSGNQYVLSEGDYPNFESMGCPPTYTIRSVKAVPLMFAIPSISLFSLECLEGKEVNTDVEVTSLTEEGFNNHILSLRVNGGCWVVCEHSNYRGQQFLLEPIEITNWPTFSSLQTIGSLYPVRQKRRFFRIKNKERGHFMSVQGGVEEMKTGRVVVTAQVEHMTDIWFYQDGLIKNKLSRTLSLQVVGNVEPAAKVVLWSETRQPIQNWTAQMSGWISSIAFPGMVLDVKGGKSYDKDHVVIMLENEERPSQQWELELL